jgi:demethylmenaquinone methyltransferase/2-methoxy-6-polyprenyl-1,4-benzoquinol methylase
LKPNGVFVILETSVPDKTPYKQGYNFTVKHTSYNCKKRQLPMAIYQSLLLRFHMEALNNILRKLGL